MYLDLIDNTDHISKKFYDANKSKKDPILTEKEEFVFTTVCLLNEINSKLNDLEFSRLFVSVFPDYKPWRKKMFREEYIIYHFL